MKGSVERRVRRRHRYDGFGFPVVLVNVPVIRIRGRWTPEVDFNEISRRLLGMLAVKPSRLTGREVRFIRHSMSMTLQKFAGRFGVTHPAVIKWERAGHLPTLMTWAVEKDIRLEIIRQMAGAGPRRFVEAYRALEKTPAAKGSLLRLEVVA